MEALIWAESNSDLEEDASKDVRKESIRCVCGRPTRPRMFRIRGFYIRGSECPRCGEGYLNGGDICRRDDFDMLRQRVMKEIDPDYGLELSAKTKKDLARSRAAAKAGRTYTLDEVKKKLKLDRGRK